MKMYSLVRAASLVAAGTCLVWGYTVTGNWLIVLAIPFMALFWIATGRRSPFRAASALLSVYVFLAVAGLALRAPALLMVAGCVFALAAWDLSDRRGQAASQAVQRYGAVLERRRLRSLAGMISASMLLAALPTMLRLQLPFGIILLLALLLTGSLLYAVHYLRASTSRRE